ncbi:MAG: prepilin peptidase [Puniceicoccales bacterium]|nr:prepilin peptidase [Puniceicoccales bacterium]
MPWFFTVCFALLGAVVGSFLNVCIHRVPRGESIAHPGSHCACGAPIPWYLNVPVLSWLLLRGRAACCGRRFGVRYPIVEALTGTLFALCWVWLPWQQAVAGMLFCAMLVVLAFIDLDFMHLPDAPNIGLAAAGLVCSFALPGLHDVAPQKFWLVSALASAGISLVGVLVGAGLLYWFRLLASVVAGREALGEGDIILLGGIGAFCGWRGAVFALFGGAVLGALILLPPTLAKRICRRDADVEAEGRAASLASCEGDEMAEFSGAGFGREVPFGPWLALGALVWFLWARKPFGSWLDAVFAVFDGLAK